VPLTKRNCIRTKSEFIRNKAGIHQTEQKQDSSTKRIHRQKRNLSETKLEFIRGSVAEKEERQRVLIPLPFVLLRIFG
jgi:hypothetical protein